MATPHATPDCRAVQLEAGACDYFLRVGDLVQAPESGWGRVILIFSPRVVIARPPRWSDHLWMPIARCLDRLRYGPQQR